MKNNVFIRCVRLLLFNKSLSNKKGFTLIELMVVISIVGFLASSSIYMLNLARLRGRDARRLSDITIIQKALELYYDSNNKYPAMYAYTSAATDGCGYNSTWCTLETSLKPYLAKLPRDPLGNQTNYLYYYDSDTGDNNQSYGVMVKLESLGNVAMANGDGGYFSAPYFEKGSQPGFCMSKYLTTNRDWWGTGAAVTVCAGGN